MVWFSRLYQIPQTSNMPIFVIKPRPTPTQEDNPVSAMCIPIPWEDECEHTEIEDDDGAMSEGEPVDDHLEVSFANEEEHIIVEAASNIAEVEIPIDEEFIDVDISALNRNWLPVLPRSRPRPEGAPTPKKPKSVVPEYGRIPYPSMPAPKPPCDVLPKPVIHERMEERPTSKWSIMEEDEAAMGPELPITLEVRNMLGTEYTYTQDPKHLRVLHGVKPQPFDGYRPSTCPRIMDASLVLPAYMCKNSIPDDDETSEYYARVARENPLVPKDAIYEAAFHCHNGLTDDESGYIETISTLMQKAPHLNAHLLLRIYMLLCTVLPRVEFELYVMEYVNGTNKAQSRAYDVGLVTYLQVCMDAFYETHDEYGNPL